MARRKANPDKDWASYKDEKGRFVKGNPGGPGRQPREWKQFLHDSFQHVFKDEDVHAIFEVWKQKCLEGERYALHDFIEHTLGRPQAPVVLAELKSPMMQLMERWVIRTLEAAEKVDVIEGEARLLDGGTTSDQG